ncbi:hypothetical protein H8M03_05805 [Sphingomonas sabuli]|uniref:Uncharacterized protein n=1 Tax=Sphingomonas sabuli TaxID=2764186 RepID=A0A7G9L5D4_9SPHN|nr:hypothetical protein [Sphingomonas sabuli]QNM83833.1 hypothetical protein H8M03_05805 [Sphingomonas sabuli]
MPATDAPLDRAGLLAAVVQAASASAAGGETPEDVRALDGRQFEMRIRFGCRGPAKALDATWLGWSFDAQNRTLRVQARPTVSIEEPLVGQIAGDGFEGVEGFWIPRPWLLQSTCPATIALSPKKVGAPAEDEASEAKPPATGAPEEAPLPAIESKGEPEPTAPRIGVAQFFTSDDARTHRRGTRPYSAVKTVPEGTPLPSQGFNLVLSGRLRALPGRSAIACQAKGADTPPECLVSVEFLRVWIEQPQTQEVIAEWGGG